MARSVDPHERRSSDRARPRPGLALLLLGTTAALVPALLAGGARSAGTVPGQQSSGQIAFARHDGIYAMRADGGAARRLWSGAQAPTEVAWSPDGRRLAFVAGDTLRVAGGGGSGPVRALTRRGGPGTSLASPSWAPDGARIAFTARDGDDRDIWTVRPDGGGLRRLTRTPRHYELDVDWGPGARLAVTVVYATASIVGTSDPDASPDVWVVSTDGRYLRNLTPGPLRGWGPEWSPDGRRIVLALWLGPERRTELFVSEPHASRLARLTDDRLDESGPSWSPDGRRIVYVRGATGVAGRPPATRGDAEIHVVNSDGSGLVRLTRNRVAEASPSWRPGG